MRRPNQGMVSCIIMYCASTTPHPAFWTNFWTATKHMITAIPAAFPPIPGCVWAPLVLVPAVGENLRSSLDKAEKSSNEDLSRFTTCTSEGWGSFRRRMCVQQLLLLQQAIGGSAGPVHLMALEPGKHRHHYTVPYYAINTTKHHDIS